LLKDQLDSIPSDDVILARYATEQPDKLKLVSTPVSTARYGIGLRKGATRRRKVTAALRAMLADGSWDRFVHDNVGQSGYQVQTRPEIVDDP